VTERPILFSGPMIPPILDGSKTQTRRLRGLNQINENPGDWRLQGQNIHGEWLFYGKGDEDAVAIRCPYGVPGDRLWVREGFALLNEAAGFVIGNCEYRATAPDDFFGIWRPSIHLPRKFSRILLEVTGVKVERVQDISWKDAAAEGVTAWGGRDCPGCVGGMCSHPDEKPCSTFMVGYKVEFNRLWDTINSKQFPLSANPWVWAVAFRRLS